MQVIFTPSAERQLDALHRYIADHSFESRADTYVGRLVSFCQALVALPEPGTRRDDILADLRTTVFVRRVTVAYVIDRDTIVIDGVYGRDRDDERDIVG